MNITNDNIDEATAEELQKYMDDHGVADIRMSREHHGYGSGVMLTATLRSGAVINGGPFKNLGEAMRFLVRQLEEN